MLRDKDGGWNTRWLLSLQRAATGVIPVEELGEIDAEDRAYMKSILRDMEVMKAGGNDNVNLSLPDFDT